jgi:tRNA A22 N-methylase
MQLTVPDIEMCRVIVMNTTVTLEVPEEVMQSARDVAERTQRTLEDVLREWLDRSAMQIPVEQLSDDQVLRLTEMELDAQQQSELSDLLAKNREETLSLVEQRHLDELMQLYRQGLRRKAEALKVAVDRKLIPPLDEE